MSTRFSTKTEPQLDRNRLFWLKSNRKSNRTTDSWKS